MLGNSGLLLLASCTVDRGKFCVLMETWAQCCIRACSPFKAHHVCHNRPLNLTFCALFSLIPRAGVVLQSSMKFPWVSTGREQEQMEEVAQQWQHRICNFLPDFEGPALTSALLIYGRVWERRAGGHEKGDVWSPHPRCCAENPWNETQQALGNPW